MKRYEITLLLLLAFLVPCHAQTNTNGNASGDSLQSIIKIKKQPRFYLSVHGGYAIGLGSTFKFYPDDIVSIKIQQVDNNPQSENVQYKQQKKGLGDGFRAGVGLSYIINDFINVGLDFDYFKSSISKTRDSSFTKISTTAGTAYNYAERYKISYDATLLTFSPNITFKAISKPKFFIYNKIGATFIIRPNSIQYESQNQGYTTGSSGDSSSTMSKRYKWGLQNPAFGFMGGIGAQVRISEKIRAFGELQFTHVVFKVKNRILTNYKVNGDEKINTLNTSEKELDFKSNYTLTGLDFNPNAPTITTSERFPITYIGMQLGLAYRF